MSYGASCQGFLTVKTNWNQGETEREVSDARGGCSIEDHKKDSSHPVLKRFLGFLV